MSTKDQAIGLRSRMEPQKGIKREGAPILAIASGKGGVGKSQLAVNLSLLLASKQKRVLLFDADFGLGNTDIILGTTPKFTLVDAIKYGKSLSSIATCPRPGLTLVAAGSGNYDLANTQPAILDGILYEMERMSKQHDKVIIDTAAGIGERTISSILLADEVIVVVTPDPSALTDSYATIKLTARQDALKKFHIVVNMARSDAEAYDTFVKLNRVSQKYLKLNLSYFGNIPYDRHFELAVGRQQPVVEVFPKSDAAVSFGKMLADVQVVKPASDKTKWPEWFRNLLSLGKLGSTPQKVFGPSPNVAGQHL